MLNDIFATSMAGEFRTGSGGGESLIEQGKWEYTGYGNAEIRMTAVAETEQGLPTYSLMIHSAERQLDEVELTTRRSVNGRVAEQRLRAVIAGHDIAMVRYDGEDEQHGSLTSPDEAIYDGPSPVWMIHLMLTAPPPVDREIVAPVVYLDGREGLFSGRFYRFKRDGLHVDVVELDNEGEVTDRFSIELADDGCPRLIQRGDTITEIIRIPRSASA